MTISQEALKQLRLTMRSLGCVETTTTRMNEGNLRFNDPTIQRAKVDYIIYANTGVVRRVLNSGDGCVGNFSPLNAKNACFDWRKGESSILQAKNEAELLLIAVRGVINYRK